MLSSRQTTWLHLRIRNEGRRALNQTPTSSHSSAGRTGWSDEHPWLFGIATFFVTIVIVAIVMFLVITLTPD
jgi:hypothetical protein